MKRSIDRVMWISEGKVTSNKDFRTGTGITQAGLTDEEYGGYQ